MRSRFDGYSNQKFAEAVKPLIINFNVIQYVGLSDFEQAI